MRCWAATGWDLAKPVRSVFLDLTGRLGSNSAGELGLLALAFHPDYRTNRQFYVWHTNFTGSGRGANGTSRLVRFLASASDPNAADPASEQRYGAGGTCRAAVRSSGAAR